MCQQREPVFTQLDFYAALKLSAVNTLAYSKIEAQTVFLDELCYYGNNNFSEFIRCDDAFPPETTNDLHFELMVEEMWAKATDWTLQDSSKLMR